MVAWAFVVASATGLLLGLWLRVFAVLAASLVTVFACIVLAPITNWSLLTGIVFCAGLLATLQVSYLVGVFSIVVKDYLRP